MSGYLNLEQRMDTRRTDAKLPTTPTQCLSETERELQDWGVYLDREQAERLRALEIERRPVWVERMAK